jgi:hypothetical protein
MSKEALKKQHKRIYKNTCEHNHKHKKECSFNNWVARLVGYLDFGKKIWPVPSEKEVSAFKDFTGYKPRSRSIKLKGGKNKCR